MSRIGEAPIEIPDEVEADIKDGVVTIKGPLGELFQPIPDGVSATVDQGQVIFTRATQQKKHRALHGLVRALVANMVTGVVQGFEKRLEYQGVGYRAQMQGKSLRLYVGFSHEVVIEPLEGVEIEISDNDQIVVRGTDKQVVGQMAADIRAVKRVGPYWAKGTQWRGIKYVDEQLRRKPGKQAKIGVE